MLGGEEGPGSDVMVMLSFMTCSKILTTLQRWQGITLDFMQGYDMIEFALENSQHPHGAWTGPDKSRGRKTTKRLTTHK